MSIGKAWCKDIAELVDKKTTGLVDIVQACQLYEGHPSYPELKGHTLEFYCPDEECRRLSKPTKPNVSAVNYKVKKGQREVRPHFRVINPETHSACCFILDRQAALDQLDQERKEMAKKNGDVKNIRPPAEICIFQPANSDVDSDHLGLTSEVENKIKALAPGRARTEGLKRVIREQPTSTMRLHEVVSRYEVLYNEDESIYRPLKVGNRPERNFQDCFRSYKEYELGTDNDYFFHGLVRVIQYGKANFAVRFLEKTCINGVSYNASFYIPYERLETYRYGKEIIKLLKKVAVTPSENKSNKTKPTAYLYFYGKFVLELLNKEGMPTKQVLNIKIDHLHSMTLREKRYPDKKVTKKIRTTI